MQCRGGTQGGWANTFFLSALFFVYAAWALALGAVAQPRYPQNYFRNPLEGPLQLAGTFGEMRPNHFHAGIDIRTGGKTGLPIYAPADGYVSRVKVSGGGFGRALYLMHPMGYTTCYGHLDDYIPEIAAWIAKEQYRRESFELDEMLPKNLIRVKKGQLIGHTGNSGSSEAPHLHFEIRDAVSEAPINPLLFGMELLDDTKPFASYLALYPFDGTGRINGRAGVYRTPLIHAGGGEYRIPGNAVPTVGGLAYVAVISEDKMEGIPNQNGIYAATALLNGDTLMHWTMAQFKYRDVRAANSMMDYAERLRTGRRYQQFYRQPGNRTEIYDKVQGQGLFRLPLDSVGDVVLILRDYNNNTAYVRFRVRGAAPGPPPPAEDTPIATLICTRSNTVKRPAMEMHMDAYTVYDTLRLTYATEPGAPNMLSDLHQVHNYLVPVHDYYSLALAPNQPLSERLRAKTVMMVREGVKKGCLSGRWVAGNFFQSSPRGFGVFYLSADTTNPTITPLTFGPRQVAPLRRGDVAAFRIADDLSGIAKFEARLDDKWTLIEYEQKTNRLLYRLPTWIKPGAHEFELTIRDKVGNSANYMVRLLVK